MAILNDQPTNPNNLTQNRFRLVLQRAPTIEFFTTQATVPSIELAVARQQNPFTDIPRPGTKMTFDAYPITFRVDEDLRNYLEVYNWMCEIGFPNSFEGYSHMKAQNRTEFSDASLMLLTSAQNTNVEVKFIDMFPVALSSLNFDITDEGANPLFATATFMYQRFVVNRVGKPTA